MRCRFDFQLNKNTLVVCENAMLVASAVFILKRLNLSQN